MKIVALAILMSSLICTACDDESNQGVACTDLAAGSVSVAIVDSEGNELPGATVVYHVDDGEELTATCVDASEAQCAHFVAGWEVTGHFVIEVTKVGYEDAQAEATIVKDADGCHVQGQAVTITLISVP